MLSLFGCNVSSQIIGSIIGSAIAAIVSITLFFYGGYLEKMRSKEKVLEDQLEMIFKPVCIYLDVLLLAKKRHEEIKTTQNYELDQQKKSFYSEQLGGLEIAKLESLLPAQNELTNEFRKINFYLKKIFKTVTNQSEWGILVNSSGGNEYIKNGQNVIARKINVCVDSLNSVLGIIKKDFSKELRKNSCFNKEINPLINKLSEELEILTSS